MAYFSIIPQTTHVKIFHVFLWITQILLFGLFCTAGVLKLTMPIAKVSKMWPWTGQVSHPFLQFIAVVDLAGGVGILLPSLTHFVPQLTVLAALGCTLLQLLAIGFHASHGEIGSTPFNFFVLALCVFVLWGRYKKAPVLPRN